MMTICSRLVLSSLGMALVASPVQAGKWTKYCNAACIQKCNETAHLGGLTKAQCYEKWGKISYEQSGDGSRVTPTTKKLK